VHTWNDEFSVVQLAKLSNGLDEGQVGCCQHNKWFKTLENYRIRSPKPL